MAKTDKKADFKEPEIPTQPEEDEVKKPAPTVKKQVQKKFSKFQKGK